MMKAIGFLFRSYYPEEHFMPGYGKPRLEGYHFICLMQIMRQINLLTEPLPTNCTVVMMKTVLSRNYYLVSGECGCSGKWEYIPIFTTSMKVMLLLRGLSD